MSTSSEYLIPPYRFDRVENKLYRGGYPKERNFKFLKQLELKTIISLIPVQQDDNLNIFCQKEGIKHIFISIDIPDENVTLDYRAVCECLKIITDESNLPLFVHCLNGSNVTGLLIMCLRKLQLWRKHSYHLEFTRFIIGEEVLSEETDFVDDFTGEGLVLANPFVPWLWPHKQKIIVADRNKLPFNTSIHPTMKKLRLSVCSLPLSDIQTNEKVIPDETTLGSRNPSDKKLSGGALLQTGGKLETGPGFAPLNDESALIPGHKLFFNSGHLESAVLKEKSAPVTTEITRSTLLSSKINSANNTGSIESDVNTTSNTPVSDRPMALKMTESRYASHKKSPQDVTNILDGYKLAENSYTDDLKLGSAVGVDTGIDTDVFTDAGASPQLFGIDGANWARESSLFINLSSKRSKMNDLDEYDPFYSALISSNLLFDKNGVLIKSSNRYQLENALTCDDSTRNPAKHQRLLEFLNGSKLPQQIDALSLEGLGM